jgi:hypothetical protein
MPQTRSYRKAGVERRVASADGLTDSLANQAALDLCCAVHTISPVRIEPAKGGDYTIRWAGGGAILYRAPPPQTSLGWKEAFSQP